MAASAVLSHFADRGSCLRVVGYSLITMVLLQVEVAGECLNSEWHQWTGLFLP